MIFNKPKPIVGLYEYQLRYIKDQSRFKIGMFARQTGKTHSTTLEIVEDCYKHEVEGKSTRWVILSRGERQAKEAIETGVKVHAKAIGLALTVVEETRRDIDGNEYKALEVKIGNSRITALPASPDTARGFSANVFLDEFAFHKDSKKIWAALFPVISAGYKLRVVSTPNGKDNKFYELMTSEDSVWSRHIVDIYQAVKQGLPRDIEELKAGLADDDAWAQEYELKWLDEASSWLPFDLINSVEDERAGIPENYQGGLCFAGNDIARRRDLWIFWLNEIIGDVLWTREIRTLKNASFKEQDHVMAEMFQKYNIVRLCMDQTGMGEKPVEDAKYNHGEDVVEGVTFTAPSKLRMATVGKEAFQDRKIRIPQGDTKLRTALHKLKKIPTATGFRFDADRDAGGHADEAWGCFLSVLASKGAVSKYEVEAAGCTRKRSSGRGAY